MGTSGIFYYIGMRGTDACGLTKSAFQEARRTWLCPGCNAPKPGLTAIDLKLQGKNLPKNPLNIVFGAGIGVARREFLEEFGPEIIKRDLYIGRVRNEDDVELPDFVSFRGRHNVLVRGVHLAGYRTCADCGRNVYYAGPKWYLYPAPAPGVDLFESNTHQLVSSEKAFENLTPKRWNRRVHLTKLHILEKPLDGFVELKSET
jgi:rubredoxin